MSGELVKISIRFDGTDTSGVRGVAAADILVGFEAELFVLDSHGRELVREPCFPVAELARELSAWLRGGLHDDFTYESDSYEEVGYVVFAHIGEMWRFSTVLAPTVGEYMSAAELTEAIEEFVADVRADLTRQGLNAERVLGRN